MPGDREPLQKRVGKLLRAARKAKGWTQARLAEESRTSYDMVVKMELGRTGARFPTIERLADALEIDPGELFIAAPYPGASRTPLNDLMATLATLPPGDLAWLRGVVEAALKPKS